VSRRGGGRGSSLRRSGGGGGVNPFATAGYIVDINGTNITETSGKIDTLLDQSGNGNHYTQATAANRPARIAAGGPYGRDAVDFRLVATRGVNVSRANVGAGTGPVTTYTVSQIGTSGRYISDGAAINSRASFNNGGTMQRLFAGAAAADVAVLPGQWVIEACVFNGASSKHSVDGGVIATGNVGATTDIGDTWGGTAGIANDAQGLNALAVRRIVYNVAHTDAEINARVALLHVWLIAGATSPRIFAAGDSIVYGANAYVGGWRPEATTTIRVSRANATFVGPYFSTGGHRGVSGETADTVASNLTAFSAQITPDAVDCFYLAWGVNDIGGGRSSAQIETSLNAIIDQCQSTRPGKPILVQSIIKPGAGAAAGYGTNRAVADTVNAALPALCTAQGVTFVDVGTPALDIDQIHPTAAGYTSMAAIIAPAIVAVT